MEEMTEEALREAYAALNHIEPPETGIPAWAADEYRADSARVLVASVTGGKIGSIYFDTGRIRTTHGAGPAREDHSTDTITQFNVDENQAVRVFQRTQPKLWKKYQWGAFDEWLAKALNKTPVKSLPAWIRKIDGPGDADVLDPTRDSGLKLFEIFTRMGRVVGWHPSRGAAVRFETHKQAVSVLNAAIDKADAAGGDARARNEVFYSFVQSRLPEFVAYLRRPDEVDY